MYLYKGSKLNLSPFQPQPVHPEDIKKFPQPATNNVSFTKDNETQAKIYACFSTCISFSIHTSLVNPKIKVMVDRELDEEKRKENVYIYTFNSEDNGWKYLEDSREWYSEIEQKAIDIKKYTREEILSELKRNPDIEIIKDSSNLFLT